MALDMSFYTTDMRSAIDDVPVTIVYGDATCTGTRTALEADKVYAEFGSRESYKFSVDFLIADFGENPLPEADSIVTVDGTDYRVLSTVTDSVGKVFTLHLGGAY